MKNSVVNVVCAFLVTAGSVLNVNAQTSWKPAGQKIMTSWAQEVTPQNVWAQYPRPQMVREKWQSLNGLWNYAILPQGTVNPTAWQGDILVPFAVESALSGVGKSVGKDNELWYHREFAVPAAWKGERILLHFGAVDWRATVYVNDILVGSHQGGYTPFSFDITPYLNVKGTQTLTLCVWDPTNQGYQPRGKQVEKPGSIWYTAVTGIWQSVWMEPVPKMHITSVETSTLEDLHTLAVTVRAADSEDGVVQVKVMDKGKVVAQAKGIPGATLRLSLAQPVLWEPSNPYLYDLQVDLTRNGEAQDCVQSYTALRTISVARCPDGFARMQLNGNTLFQMGPLDQGWWPDGLYTAPSDEALAYDIEKTKELGFNMIRKHVKVEPDRWYYHCDRLGMLVWQDMPSGDMNNDWEPEQYNAGTDAPRTAESEANYRREWKEIIDLCRPHPCVVVWVPFNEAWGQFKTEDIVAWTKAYDPTRLVNPASGGNHRPCGDILDLHNYPGPKMALFDPQRVNVLGEYGGIGLALEGHLWEPERNWGYVQFKTPAEVTAEYVKYAEQLQAFVKKGFAAAVYTQTTDCEIEVNGLMTYDRKVLKVDAQQVRAANTQVIASGTGE